MQTFEKRDVPHPVFRPKTIWFVDDGDQWKVMCMDCGIRLGTVNAGNEEGAVHLTSGHDERMHRD